MNIQQLEYIVAVDRFKHFGQAAQHCFVSQPTLSAMIMKLEDELGIKVFARTHQPTLTTEDGKALVLQAQKILLEVEELKTLAMYLQGKVKGIIHLGIIPTIAPYLLPLFVDSLLKAYPELKLHIRELTTDDIVTHLEDGTLDAGILATPLGILGIEEDELYNEPFVVFKPGSVMEHDRMFMTPNDLDPEKIWLLQQGHCLRNQLINLCELQDYKKVSDRLRFEAGSVETLIEMVKMKKGLTLLPALALDRLNPFDRESIFEFEAPIPVRQISFVFKRRAKERLFKSIVPFIQSIVKPRMEAMINERDINIIRVF